MTTPTSARERLRTWVAEQESRAAAARLIGCDPTYLTHLLKRNSRRRPGLDVAFNIQHATAGWNGGQIRAQEWTELVDVGSAGTEA